MAPASLTDKPARFFFSTHFPRFYESTVFLVAAAHHCPPSFLAAGLLATGLLLLMSSCEKLGPLESGSPDALTLSESPGDNLLRENEKQSKNPFSVTTMPCVAAISLLPAPQHPSTGAESPNKYLSFIFLPPSAEGKEQKAVLRYSFYVINGGKGNNFDLYSQHTKAFVLEPNPAPINVEYELKSTFTVEVK